jgi:hypothetical protein
MALTIAHVRRYIELGMIIHPCCPPDHCTKSPGKIPYIPGEGHMTGWQHHRKFSLAQWQEWIDYDSEINIGFLTGSPSSLVCLDIDNDEGMALLEKIDPDWKSTWAYQTGRGLRVLYRKEGPSPSGIITRGDASIEVLGDGRQSVLPPSVHPNGSEYHWRDGSAPKDCGCSSRTDWLSHLGSSGGGIDGLNSDETDWSSILQTPPRPGERNNSFTSIAGHLMSPGGGMSEGEASFWLRLYNKTLPEPLDDRELAGIVRSIRRSEERTIQSGERDIKKLMVTHGLSYQDAKLMWSNMG